jgi:hypothetical protein
MEKQKPQIRPGGGIGKNQTPVLAGPGKKSSSLCKKMRILQVYPILSTVWAGLPLGHGTRKRGAEYPTLIPLGDFKAILGLDDREDALSQYLPYHGHFDH